MISLERAFNDPEPIKISHTLRLQLSLRIVVSSLRYITLPSNLKLCPFQCQDESIMSSLINLEVATALRGGFLELLQADPKYLHIWYFDRGFLKWLFNRYEVACNIDFLIKFLTLQRTSNKLP